MKRNLIVALLAGLLLVAPSARAADPAFVGVLALAVEEQVAKELGLSDEVRKQLDELIQAREDEILNLGLRELSDDEQKAKLAAFAAESEKQGLALLSKEQQTKLMQIGVARRGLSTLADAKVAQAIGLDEKQRSNITKMLDGLKGKLAAGTETERKIAKAEAERGLNLILTKEQRAAWDKLAGLGGGGEEKPAEAVAKGDDEQPADEKPAATKPEATRPGSRKPDDKKPELSKPQPPKNIDDVRLRMNFSYTPWKAVLEWLAEEADLSLVGDTMPPGTCNYKDSRSYTVSQAIDILNGQLQLRGFTVVRRERMLFVWDMENGTVPAHIAPLVTPAELDKRGEFELLTCVFSFSKLTPEEVEGDIRKLIGPGGSMTVLSKLKRLSVTETGGKLRSIRDIIKEADAPASLESSEPLEQTHPVVYPIAIADPESVLQVLQTLLAGQANLRISKDPKTGNIVANGTPAQHASIKALIDEMQQDKRSFTVIKLKKLDPELVVADLKSLFGIVEGQTNTNHPKLIANPTMKYIGVFGSKQQIEQIRTAVIEMGESPAGSNDSMPTVRSYSREIPLTGRSLNAALEQFQAIAPVYLTNEIRVVKSPAVTDGVGEIPSRVPVPKEWEKKAARPAANTNSASSPPRGDDEDRGYRGFGRGGFGGFGRGDFRGGGDYRGRGDDRGSEERRPEGERPQGEDRRSQRLKPPQYYYVAWQDPESTEEESEPKEPARQNVPLVSEESASKEPAEEEPAEKPATPSGRKSAAPPPQKTTPGAEVVITITPNGIVVSSQDLDALDKVEEMLSQFVNEDPGKEYTIFKLRYARADVAAELLGQALGGGSSDDSGGGSPLGDIAGQMFGGGGMGGIMGAMLGGGGGGSSVISSGPVLLIPDNRLNVILAQGKPGDLDIAEMLLKIIDLPDSGVSVEVVAKPRFIPVLHTTAAEMAETIKQVYANRMVTPPGQPQQVSPQQLMQALAGGGRRGGRGGGAGGGNDRKSEEQKMSIGVDEKSNSLIVSAPPALFDEIAQLVEELDIATSQKDEFVWIGNSATNAALIEQSLASILGDDVEITRVGTTTTTPGRGTQRNNNTSRTANNQNQRQPGNQQFSPQQIQTFMQGQGRGGGGGGFPGGGGFQGGGGGPGGGGGQGQGRGGGGGGRNR